MNRRWITLLAVLVVLATPVALFALSLRITTSHWLVRWEYNQADFPADPYGMSTEQRIELADVCVDYLVTGAGIDRLADLELDGQPAFNARELGHMRDVKRVLRWLLGAGAVAGLLVVGGAAALALWPGARGRAPVALQGGSALTMGLLLLVGGLMATQWNTFFTGFHELFFPPGTWMFPFSDTLIRLYPVRFWMDVGTILVGLLALEAALLGLVSFLWGRFWGRDRAE